ncbi:hypothetical protein BX600DRAFT_318253 [Xylariales sp. PMI_506]|nr:hypothetical protein BX600DRAFT_318253 [Xylariales sp. PMI_506]
MHPGRTFRVEQRPRQRTGQRTGQCRRPSLRAYMYTMEWTDDFIGQTTSLPTSRSTGPCKDSSFSGNMAQAEWRCRYCPIKQHAKSYTLRLQPWHLAHERIVSQLLHSADPTLFEYVHAYYYINRHGNNPPNSPINHKEETSSNVLDCFLGNVFCFRRYLTVLLNHQDPSTMGQNELQ